ncbi:MAG: hypothetical protein Q9227_008705 [Pyrenula ochraceoflavens]
MDADGPEVCSQKVCVRRVAALQPFVEQTCVFNPLSNPGIDGGFVSFENHHSNLNTLIPLAKVLPNTTNSSTAFQYLGISSGIWRLQTHSEMVAFYERPPDSNHSLLVTTAQNNNGVYGVWGCTIDATWRESSVNITLDGGSDLMVYSALKDEESLKEHSTSITITPDWALRATELHYAMLNNLSTFESNGESVFSEGLGISSTLALALSDISLTTGASESFPGAFTRFTKSTGDPKQMSQMNPKQYDAMRNYLQTNGYLHQCSTIMVYTDSADGNWTDPASLAQFHVKQYVTGYGYNTSIVPVQLSLFVLGLYSLVVLAYLVYSLATGRSGNSWDSIGDLFMLAMNSKQPEHLYSTSVGVDKSSTFGEPINIRENESGSVEVVFQNDPGLKKRHYKSVQPNVRY